MELVTVVLCLVAAAIAETRAAVLPWRCNFDLNNFCDMEQIQGKDQFDWTLGYGRTPTGRLHVNDSENTGPGGGQGGSQYYIYMEASYPRQSGDITRILTPNLEFGGSSEICLDFYYHMLGALVGSLAVYTQPANQVLDNLQPVWQQDRAMGDNWFRVQLTTNLRYQERVEFRGTIGGNDMNDASWSGDLAFDTIQISAGRCTGGGPVPLPTAVPSSDLVLPFACDFESSLCGMRTEQSPGVRRWTRISGQTPSAGVGPTRAFSGFYYLYTETSEPAQVGDLFILTTLPIRFDGPACLSFAYHMSGSSSSRFIITTDQRRVYIFDKTGYQGPDWIEQSLEIQLRNSFTLEFLVIRGNDIRGDVAIDNARIDPYKCSNLGRETPTTPPVPTPAPTAPPPTTTTVRQGPWQCGFERDFCGMQQANRDQFDWMRNSLQTTTVGTGPDAARSGVQYIYTETSDPRVPGDTALIATPMLNIQGDLCLEFYYHMYGSGMGTMRLYITRFGPGFRKFERVGNQGSRWLYARVDVDNFNYGDSITFEGIRGNSYTSDMALDDIKVTTGLCSGGGGGGDINPTPIPTPRPPVVPSTGERFSCSMETTQGNDINCRLRQDTREDQIDWLRTFGKTPSGALYSRRTQNGLFPVTGPDAARVGAYYLYIEASGKPRDLVARLFIEGSDVTRGGPACLRFYYSMNGYHMGMLRVITRHGGSRRDIKWQLVGDQGQGWQSAAVDLTLNGLSELGIEATTRGQFSGDIAIDDIKVQPGFCESTPSQYLFLCNFETGAGSATLCQMEQDRADRFDWRLGKGPTPSQVTGPDRAFSGQYYVYIEASKPRQRGDDAVLLTPALQWNGALCVELMYHMYGFHIGTLQVLTRDGFTAASTQWTETGQKGNRWLQARVSINNFRSGSKIGFKGVRAAEYSGDIAIDSITVRRNRC